MDSPTNPSVFLQDKERVKQLEFLVNYVSFSYRLRHLQADALPRFRSRNVRMFNLNGIHNLLQIRSGSFDKNAITYN